MSGGVEHKIIVKYIYRYAPYTVHNYSYSVYTQNIHSPFLWRTFGWTALWTLVGTARPRWNFIPVCVHLEAIDVCLLFHQLPFLIFEFIQAFSKISMYSVWTKPQWIHLSSLSLLLVGVLQEYFCSLRNLLWLVFSVIRFFLPLLWCRLCNTRLPEIE